MLRFLFKTPLHCTRNGYVTVTAHNPSMVVSLSLLRYSSSDASNPHSFTLSYLINSCGLSLKSALSASKRVQFESSELPDSVLSSFQKFGFSKTQISEMVRKYPRILCCNPKKTISPRIEFFRSKGASTPDLVKIFTSNPWIVRIGLQNQVIRLFDILVELFKSEYKVIEALTKNPWVLHSSPGAGFLPNINVLREHGVPPSNILQLIRIHWLCISSKAVRFRKSVEEVKKMGFDPLKSQFVTAVMVLTITTKSKWDGRVEIYRKWGWSDKDITTAFRKHPRCMTYSEDKIMATMDFYVNELGLASSVIVNCPVLLGLSLKKRLIARGVVIQFLSSKGLVKLDSSITTMLKCSESCFLEKYVKDPYLEKLYKEKLERLTQSTKVED